MGFQPLWGFDVQGKERGLLKVSLQCRDPKPYAEREESSPGSLGRLLQSWRRSSSQGP